MSATVVSLLPFDLKERKVGLIPPDFHVPAAVEGVPGVLVIPDGDKAVRTHTYIDEVRQSLSIKNPSGDIAQSIVYDWLQGQLILTEDARPGLFWVEGALTGKQVLEQHPELVAKYKALQHEWFKKLVSQADADYARTGSSRSVSDIHKHAARGLGISPAWMNLENIEQVIKCPACRSTISALATICPQCRTELKKAAK